MRISDWPTKPQLHAALADCLDENVSVSLPALSKNDDSLNAARNVWDNIDIQKVRDVSWLAFPRFSIDSARAFSGKRHVVDYCHAKLIARKNSTGPMTGAALVCGDMEGERHWFQSTHGAGFKVVHGYDLSPASLDRAIKKTKQDPFDFTPHCADCNVLSLPTDHFDFIVGLHGIHHVQNLDHLFKSAARSLKPHGLMFLHEWIGPKSLQYPLRNSIFSSLLINCLVWPLKRRTNHLDQFRLICKQAPPSSFDPSEACNSSQIMPTLKRYFKVTDFWGYGGLNYPIFEGLALNFNQTDSYTKALTQVTTTIETWLTRAGAVKPLFAYILCEPKEQE